MQIACGGFAGRIVGGMALQLGEKVARDSRTDPLPPQPKRVARPLDVALLQKWQIEQPFARIIDDAERQRRRVAADAREQLPE
jgi:hypothetical protein